MRLDKEPCGIFLTFDLKPRRGPECGAMSKVSLKTKVHDKEAAESN